MGGEAGEHSYRPRSTATRVGEGRALSNWAAIGGGERQGPAGRGALSGPKASNGSRRDAYVNAEPQHERTDEREPERKATGAAAGDPGGEVGASGA